MCGLDHNPTMQPKYEVLYRYTVTGAGQESDCNSETHNPYIPFALGGRGKIHANPLPGSVYFPFWCAHHRSGGWGGAKVLSSHCPMCRSRISSS